MNVDQLALIADKADRYADYVVEGCDGVIVACQNARAEVVSMRTPITPESLEADGWKLERYTAGVYSKTIGEVTVRLDAIAKMFAFGKGSFLWVQIFATSIHDLRQLERLIGGAR